MKHGVIVYKETENIGDDIQSYAASCLLPEVNYYIEREHMDIFRPNENEPVNTIMNGWFMYNKLGWPLSGYINPLYISMHFLTEDSMLIADDFLKGLGAEDLMQHGPVGARDTSTMLLLEKNNIPCYFSGCLTLTLPRKFHKPVEKPYLCLTDISEDAVAFVRKKYSNFDIHVVEHEPLKNPPMVDSNADWETRFKKVEELLELYQNATAVVTTRLHCAMPCLALNTPVLLLDDHNLIEGDRLSGLSDFVHSSTTRDFIDGKIDFNLSTPPKNPTGYLVYRKKLIETVQHFLASNTSCTPELRERIASYDKDWEKRALWKNKILQNLAHKHNKQWNEQHDYLEEVERGKKWLETQYFELKHQNAALTQENDGLKRQIDDLKEGYIKVYNDYENLRITSKEVWDAKCQLIEDLNSIEKKYQETQAELQETQHKLYRTIDYKIQKFLNKIKHLFH